MNREIGTILRLLVFIGIGLVFLIFLNLNNGPSINIINVNFYPNAPLNHQLIQLNNKKCHRIFSEMQKLHSTFGRTQPRKLEETKEIFNNKDNNMPVSKEWLLDQEFKAIINQPVEFTVTNKEIYSKIERIVNKLEYNSFDDFNIEKVLRENVAADELKNAKIGVLGLYELTYDPWLESLLYLTSNSTARISLLDHQNRKYENAAHFKWSHISDVLRRNEAGLFDILVDYHVSERLGLGRYGEDMSLNADSDTVELAHCLLKPGGLLVLSVSLAREADELASYGHVVYNVGRMYGEKRLQRMIDGWTVRSESVFRYGTVKVYVLQKN